MASLEIKGYSVDEISKALGAAAIAAYVLGYFILSYHLSNFGLNSVSPFRPRVFETGICALLFCAIPTLMGLAAASIPGREMPLPTTLMMRVLVLPFLCNIGIEAIKIITYLSTIELTRPPKIPAAIFWIILSISFTAGPVLTVLLFKGLRWLWRNYHQKPFASIALLVLLAITFTTLQVNPGNSPFIRRMFLWFVSVSTTTCLFIGSDRDDAAARTRSAIELDIQDNLDRIGKMVVEINKLEEPEANEQSLTLESEVDNSLEMMLVRCTTDKAKLEGYLLELRSYTSSFHLKSFFNAYAPVTFFIFVMFAVALYGAFVFPVIPLKLGGGEILSITLYEIKTDIPPKTVYGGLLDESDQGFFILPPGSDKGLFVPKERVEAIYFARGPADLQQLTK